MLGLAGGVLAPRRSLAQAVIDPATIPGPAWAGGVKGGRGINVWQDTSVNFDPLLTFDRADYYNLSSFFRGLTFMSVGSEPQLDLAEYVDISADGLTYTFTLRDGILFHNGRPAVTEDFRWTIERAVSPAQASWVQGFMSGVEGHAAFVAGTADTLSGVTAPDDRTLVIRLATPDARLLNILAIPPFYVLPREEVERLGDAFRETPISTGPYRLGSFDSAGSTMIATRFDDYIYRDHLPYLDEIEIQWNVTEDIQYLKVSRRDADLSMSVPSSVVGEIQADASFAKRFSAENSLDTVWWPINVKKAPFDDVRVRQAINHAVNLSRTAAFGVNPIGHLYPPSLLGFSDQAPIYGYDPDKARALLAEAGVTDLEMRIGVMTSSFADNVRIAQLIAQDLEAVGIKVVLEQRQESPYDLGAALVEDYAMWNMSWGMGLPDPSELATNHFGTGGAANLSGYSNSGIDTKAQAALGITDRDARAKSYAEIEAELLADAPFLFVGIRKLFSLRSARLQNFVYDPAIWTYWDRYWSRMPDLAVRKRADGTGIARWLRADVAVGGTIVAVFVLCAIAPNLIAGHDPLASPPDGLTAAGGPRPPGDGGFVLGTDVLGRDVFARIVYGARVAVLIAVVPNLIALAVATLIALTAGYRRGIVEVVLMRMTEAFLVLPVFLIAMAVIATFGSFTTTIVLTLAFVAWSYPAKVLHGEVRRLANSLHVEAARSMGASALRITLRHILPYLTPLLVVYFTMNAAYMVMLEAGLAFLGCGVQPPTPSWGHRVVQRR